jgi:hypothetical protein
MPPANLGLVTHQLGMDKAGKLIYIRSNDSSAPYTFLFLDSLELGNSGGLQRPESLISFRRA